MSSPLRFFTALFFFAASAPATAVSVSIEPDAPENGAPFLFVFDGLNPGQRYTLRVDTPRRTSVRFRPVRDRTVVVSGAGLSAGGILRWQLTADAKIVASNSVAIRTKKYRSVRFNVDEKFSAPPPELGRRLEQEARELAAVRATVSTDCWYRGPCVRPVPAVSGWTDDFGRTRVRNGTWIDTHSGADLTAGTGTPVSAFSAGRILMCADLYYAGKIVGIDHGLGLTTYYCHLSEIRVKTGERVEAGDCLGLSGATGCATAPHLHFSAYVCGIAVNPTEVVRLLSSRYGIAKRSGR